MLNFMSVVYKMMLLIFFVIIYSIKSVVSEISTLSSLKIFSLCCFLTVISIY